MNEQIEELEFLHILKECNAILEGHFVFTPKEIPPGSGNWQHFHGNVYVNKDATYWLPGYLAMLAQETAKKLVGKKIDVIVGPEKGAIALAPLVAMELSRIQDIDCLPPYWNGQIAACYAEKDGVEKMVIQRSFASEIRKIKNCQVWITEDIGNSGSSARKTVQAARDLGATVVGVSFLAVRKNLTSADVGEAPLFWLTKVEGNMWPEEECPLCKENGPQSVSLEAGKGKEFLKRKGLLAT